MSSSVCSTLKGQQLTAVCREELGERNSKPPGQRISVQRAGNVGHSTVTHWVWVLTRSAVTPHRLNCVPIESRNNRQHFILHSSREHNSAYLETGFPSENAEGSSFQEMPHTISWDTSRQSVWVRWAHDKTWVLRRCGLWCPASAPKRGLEKAQEGWGCCPCTQVEGGSLGKGPALGVRQGVHIL